MTQTSWPIDPNTPVSQKIKVKHAATAKDGGSKLLIDAKGNKYHQDFRITTTTRGKIYDKWPGDENAKMLDVEVEIVDNL